MEETKMERRRSKRVTFREPVQYQFTTQSAYGGCLASDISEGGIKINFNNFVPLGAEMAFQIFVNSIKMVKCVGRVVWVQKFPFSDRYQVGLKFEDSDSMTDSRKELRQLIESRPS